MDSIISALGQAYFIVCFSLWLQVKSGTRVALCAPRAHSHSLRASFMTIMASRTSSPSFPVEAVMACSYCNAHYEATKTSVKRCPTCQNVVDDNKYVLLQPSDSQRLLQHRACNGTCLPPVLLQGTDSVPQIAVPRCLALKYSRGIAVCAVRRSTWRWRVQRPQQQAVLHASRSQCAHMRWVQREGGGIDHAGNGQALAPGALHLQLVPHPVGKQGLERQERQALLHGMLH